MATWRNQTRTLLSISNYKLSPTEEFVLSHGLNFCLPPHSVQREEIFAEFEVLIGQLLHHVPHSSEQFSALKARLSDLTHAYCGNPVGIGDFLILKECIQATRSLRCNENIHVTKPDKGSGVVIMNKSDYISKMDFILQDNSKFENLGPSSEFDNTAKIEAHIRFNSRKTAFFHPRFTAGFDQLVHNGPKCIVCRKFTSKMYPYVLYCQ